ncbi:centromere protein X isoform X1 [Homo sapiens]|uniref:centromere protein X isoform X1 n=1 Tax=Homo sapiens TaxID=9606 RepID=UPI000D0C8310|nr:centromere protein X isoform X1 [Homo sapiens]XP_054171343.1 centromere protein X isoform X1 [Homo sapiens]|eukprot:XP_024306407.1 centromere protein X isoform X3 [Homo sapiens]
MEGAGAGSGFRKELVSRLLHLHFKDDKTKVSGDALQLMVELLKVFVVGEPRAHAPSGHSIRNFAFFQRENQDVFSRFPQGPKLGSPEPVCQKQQSAACGRPRQKTRSVWTWTSWRSSWTSRDLSRG